MLPGAGALRLIRPNRGSLDSSRSIKEARGCCARIPGRMHELYTGPRTDEWFLGCPAVRVAGSLATQGRVTADDLHSPTHPSGPCHYRSTCNYLQIDRYPYSYMHEFLSSRPSRLQPMSGSAWWRFSGARPPAWAMASPSSGTFSFCSRFTPPLLCLRSLSCLPRAA